MHLSSLPSALPAQRRTEAWSKPAAFANEKPGRTSPAVRGRLGAYFPLFQCCASLLSLLSLTQLAPQILVPNLATTNRPLRPTKHRRLGRSLQEDVYPKGPSVQFYKMFLDEGVKAELEEYDALAIIEWDVLVASDRSFAELYRAAFSNSEDFWVKGSNLEGTNFHTVAESSEMWHVMGHINGNAIYNNNDPVFAEFVEYTLARWEYRYPYDVALWATISDFPYSWPLWQHYSSKFVTTNLVSQQNANALLFPHANWLPVQALRVLMITSVYPASKIIRN